MTSAVVDVKPIKPWTKTPRQRVPGLLVALGAVLFTVALLAITPLKGKLGFFIVFVPTITVCEYLLARIQIGRAHV